MSVENSIVLVTNDEKVIQFLKPKLVLLREVDVIQSVNYENALEKINEASPEAVIIYNSKQDEACLELIKSIKSESATKNISILALVDKYNQDFLLSAYDADIADFLTLESDDAEILMRVIWALKKTAQLKVIQKQKQLFEKFGIVDLETGFFTDKYMQKIFETEYKNLQISNSNAIVMLVGVTEESKPNLDAKQLASAIKSSVRASDIVIHGGIQKFFILLLETQLKGAFSAWNRIKNNLGEQYKVVSAIKPFDDTNFKDIQKCLLDGLIEAESSGQDLIIVSDEEQEISSENWLDKINSTQKNFKLFKQAFNKKLEKVITPVFFQMQKVNEAKLFETHIEQYSNSTLSEFILKKGDSISTLKITYPGFSKINIDIIHQGLDSPENKRIGLDLTELTDVKLTKIIEGFIKDFKTSNE